MKDFCAIQKLASNAKNRLKQRGEFRENNKTVSLRAERNYLSSRNVSEKEQKQENEFYKKVKSMMGEDNSEMGSLSHLMDKREFDLLGDVGKQRYIIRLSNKLREIKVKMMNDNNILEATDI